MSFRPRTIRDEARRLGIDAKILDAARPGFFPEGVRRVEGEHALGKLRVLDMSANSDITPCTACYWTKLLALRQYMDEVGADTVVFGHHGTDAVASLLKSAFMHIDYHDNGRRRYSGNSFKLLLAEKGLAFRNGPEHFRNSLFGKRLVELVEQEKAGTQEPPVEYNKTLGGRIVRPMFDVYEWQTGAYAGENSLEAQSSGCSHSQVDTKRTARELIHFGLLHGLPQTEATRELEIYLHSLLLPTLREDGTLKFDARAMRDTLLPGYKPSGC
jgi:tRNA(Ile)-lysidine synthase TilS/MesJ